MSLLSPRRARAIVVGGGVLGTWHALELLRAGFSVEHLEADAAPAGASVRNFGLVWVSGRRSGEELDAAWRSRRRWEEVAADVPGIGFRPTGSLTVALDGPQREVMQAFARQADATARAVAFLEPDEVRAANPGVRGEIAGALHCSADGIVEPRDALGGPARLPDGASRTAAVPLPPRLPRRGRRGVRAHRRGGDPVGGDIAVVATGAAYDHPPGARAGAALLRRVRLQMLETAPFATPLTTSLADADTLRYYPAYEAAPLHLLGTQSPVAADHHLQLLLVQRPDGGLTIGDTHAYGEPFDFALSEDATEELLARAGAILGARLPPVRRRWEGVYAQCTDGALCLREELRPGLWLVTGPGGRGMTCSPAIAADTLVAAGIAP